MIISKGFRIAEWIADADSLKNFWEVRGARAANEKR